jgi:short-subunit dehydrogenase
MRVRNVVIAATAGTVTAGAVASVGAVLLGRAIWKGFREISLRGKVALITGSSRGLGFAMAQELAREGARLVICARDEEELHWAQEELQREGAEVLAIPCDVGDRDQVSRMFEQVRTRFGSLDVLINNAGVIQVGPIESQRLEDYEEAMRTMYWGVVYPTLEAIPDMMTKRSGHIANITSIGGRIAVPHLVPYCAAKFAAVGFSEGMHAELAKDGIKVTTVVPGLMRTGSHVNAYFKGDHRKEFAWFSLGASTPLTAMSARRAARNVIKAIKRGRSEITLSPQAKLAALAHGVAPGMVSNAMGLVNRVLPGTGSSAPERFTGKASRNAVSESFVTKLGRDAGKELNQYPEHRHTGTHNATTGPEALLAD